LEEARAMLGNINLLRRSGSGEGKRVEIEKGKEVEIGKGSEPEEQRMEIELMRLRVLNLKAHWRIALLRSKRRSILIVAFLCFQFRAYNIEVDFKQ
jgi:hypothetical protein